MPKPMSRKIDAPQILKKKIDVYLRLLCTPKSVQNRICLMSPISQPGGHEFESQQSIVGF